jgi:hypothetical protein
MDTKQVVLASNYHKDNEVVLISRRLNNGQRITIDCPKAVKDYNQFSHGVDQLSQRISCYNLDRKSKRNWLQMFIYFLNASISNSFICYNQLAQDKLTYLNYMVSLAQSLCSGHERISRERPPSEKYSKLASPKTVLSFDSEMHLPVTAKRRRCAYCSTNEAMDFRSNIECFTCKLPLCLTLYGRVSTTGNIAKLFSEEPFPASVKYQSHIATIKDIYCVIYSSII